MKILILAAMAASCFSAPLLDPDSVPVSWDDPRIGGSVSAYNNSTWMVYGNDNPPPTYGDFDFNDAVMRIIFNPGIGGIAQWIGANSAWVNYFVVDGKRIDATNQQALIDVAHNGQRLPIYLHTQDGNIYLDGTRNILVEGSCGPLSPCGGGEVPEPSVFILIGIGILGICILSKRNMVKGD